MLLLLFFLHQQSKAQTKDTADTILLLKQDSELVDSFELSYSNLNNLNEVKLETRSNLASCYQFHPSRLALFDGNYLGDLGLPAYPIWYMLRERKGYENGFHQYVDYQFSRDSIRIYRAKKIYTMLDYVQSGVQAEFMLKAKYAYSIKPNFNIGLEYRRISHLGSLNNQIAKHTNLAISISWQFKDKYQVTGYGLINTIRNQNNGGIVTDSLLNRIGFSPSNIAVVLEDARTEIRNFEMGAVQQYNFNSTKDTRKHYLEHTISYETNEYKYYDTKLLQSKNYYGNFLTSEKGIRLLLQEQALKNVVYYHFANAASSHFKAGFGNQLSNIYYEPKDSVVSNYFISTSVHKQFKALSAYSDFQYFFSGQNQGDYSLKLNTTLPLLSKSVFLNAHIDVQQYHPTVLQQRLFVSQQEVWNNFFKSTTESSVGANIRFPKLGIALGATQIGLKNYIYSDSLRMMKQSTQPIQGLQLLFNYKMKWKAIHANHQIGYQYFNATEVRLPNWLFQYSLYFENHIFRKIMLFRSGFDLHYHNAYAGNNFFPLTGQFYLQDRVFLKRYPLLDFVTAFEVKQFKGFFKLENLLQLFLRKSYFTAPLYPMRDTSIRFGVNWYFLD